MLQTAVGHRRAKRLRDALQCFDELLRDDPLNAEIWYEYAKALLDAGEWDRASQVLELYVAAQPSHENAFLRLAFAHYRRSDFAAAEAAYRRLLVLRGPYAPALVAIAQIRFLDGLTDEGSQLLNQALAAPAIDAESEVIHALIRLQRGDYASGFSGLEARWRLAQFTHPDWAGDPHREWRGESLADTTLCVHSEEGFGDIIMMARFLPQLRRFARNVLFFVEEPLRRLLMNQPDAVTILPKDAEIPAAAKHTGLFSLPHRIRLTAADLPGAYPYLRAASPTTRGDDRTLHVGLAWAGGAGTVHDADRSVPRFELLMPLFEVPGVSWYSLQVGVRAAECAGSPVRALPQVSDFADTADLLEGLDLVVSVDTAVAHLAGALGIPAWILVPTIPEWRWTLRRESSPWYPSARLFRRRRSRDWSEVVHGVAAALQTLARTTRSASRRAATLNARQE